MLVKKLLKRFMKENGIYTHTISKDVLEYTEDYDEAVIPFNAFRWDTTTQGHEYWYFKSIDWILNLYSSINDIDDEDKKKYGLTDNSNVMKNGMYDLLNFYFNSTLKKEELEKNNEKYNSLLKVYEKIHSS